MAQFRPTAAIPAHIEVMGVIGQVNRTFKEWQEAKSGQKKDRLAKKIEQLKINAVWIFYGKPASMEDIK